jgi:predicted RNA-binding protein with TRAM domain
VLYVSRNNNKKHNWNPYTSSVQRFSIYPTIKASEDTSLRVGDVLTVDIYDIDDKGNGVVHRGDKRIIIPNATSGSKVKVKIIKIQGDIAIGHVVKVLSESNSEY